MWDLIVVAGLFAFVLALELIARVLFKDKGKDTDLLDSSQRRQP